MRAKDVEILKVVIHPPEDNGVENQASMVEVWFNFLDSKGNVLGSTHAEAGMPKQFEIGAAKFFSHIEKALFKKHIGGLDY